MSGLLWLAEYCLREVLTTEVVNPDVIEEIFFLSLSSMTPEANLIYEENAFGIKTDLLYYIYNLISQF